MNMLSLGTGFALSLAAYLTGAFASLASWRKPALARRICCSAALAGAALGGLTSVLGILGGAPVTWSRSEGDLDSCHHCFREIAFRDLRHAVSGILPHV